MDLFSEVTMPMTENEAKAILGFLPNDHPSSSEIKAAYHRKALEAHTDRGGNLEAIKRLNIANDILTGKFTVPTYDRRSDPEVPPGPGGSRWVPPKKAEVTFEEAETKAGIPSGVQWFFVTTSQRGKSTWSSDESSLGDSAFVAYGRTEQQHVFVGARHYTRQDFYVGGTNDTDTWTIKSIEIPIQKDEGKNPAWLYGNVVKSFKGLKFEGRFNSKILDAQGWKFNRRLPEGTVTSIKHWLVGSGEVAGDAPSVAGRKHTAELKVLETYKPDSGFYEEAHNRGNFWDGKYHGQYYQMILTLDGRSYIVSEKDFKLFSSTRLGSKRLMEVIFGTYQYNASHKQLTRIKSGKKILGWMAERFTDLPLEATEILKAAEEQVKG